MTSIQAVLAACPAGFEIDTPAKPVDGAMLSVLSKDDAPMHYRLAISSSKRQDSTFVVVSYSRTADLNQLSLMFATMAYVGTARDACGWPLTAQQVANFRRFGGLYYNKEIGQARGRLEKKGRLDFCSDPAERAKYDRLAPTLFPVGDVGRLAP